MKPIKVFFDDSEIVMIDEMAKDSGHSRSAFLRLLVQSGLSRRNYDSELTILQEHQEKERAIQKKHIQATLNSLAILMELADKNGIDASAAKVTAIASVKKLFGE